MRLNLNILNESFDISNGYQINNIKNISDKHIKKESLNFDEIFALGIANGKLEILSIDLIILWLGNLIATVFKLAVAKGQIFEFCFFFKTKVIGPGQNFLNSL